MAFNVARRVECELPSYVAAGPPIHDKQPAAAAEVQELRAENSGNATGPVGQSQVANWGFPGVLPVPMPCNFGSYPGLGVAPIHYGSIRFVSAHRRL